MAVSFRTTRNMGLAFLLMVIFAESLFSYVFVSRNMMRLTETIYLNEVKLKRWYDVAEIINDAKDRLYDFRLEKVDVIAPVDLLITKAMDELKSIKNLPLDEGERANIDEIMLEAQKLRQAIYAYESEVQQGYKGGSSANEFEDIAFNITNHIAQLGRGAVAYVTQSIEEKNRDVFRVTVFSQWMLGIILFSATAATLIAAFFMARALARPIKQLVQGTQRIAGGELTYRVNVNSEDEIGQLGQAFNTMAEELKRSQSDLLSAKAYTESIIQSMTSTVIVIDRDALMVTVNKATCDLLGYEEEELIGKSINMILPGDGFQFDGLQLDNLIEDGFVRKIEINYLSKDAEKIPVLFSASVMRDINEKVQGIVCAALDNTAQKELEQKLREISITDELTGLLNRRGFITLAKKHLQVAEREKAPFALLFADVDNMKTINDNFGHGAGDQALMEVGSILSSTFRQADIISRFGGDEFAVLLTNPSEAGLESLIFQRLKYNLAQKGKKAGRGYDLSVSIGVVKYDPESPVTLDELMSKADALMYAQKQKARNAGIVSAG